MILGLDTSGDQCAVALLGPDQSWQAAEQMARGHAEALFPMIDSVLQDAGASLSDLTRVAVCTGPGSFTGIRAGVAAARGLALGLGIPSVGVSRLAALAAGRPGRVMMAMKGTSVVWQDFDADGNEMGEPVHSDTAPTGPDVLHIAPPALADPVQIARLGGQAEQTVRPAPLYLRAADALPSSDLPPRLLD